MGVRTATIMICLLLVAAIVVSACDQVAQVADPCKSTFEECNYSCGEGIFNSFCKQKCTSNYNDCKANK